MGKERNREVALKPFPREAFRPDPAETGLVVMVTDPSGTVLFVNGAYEARGGRGRYEILGKNAAQLKNRGADGLLFALIWYLVRMEQLGEEPPASCVEAGEHGIVEVHPMHDSRGRVANYVAVRRNHPADGVSGAPTDLYLSLPAWNRLVAGIVHSVNNQLCIIEGYAGLLRSRSAGSGPEGEEMLGTIEAAAARIEETMGRLLAYARMVPLMPERVWLNEFLSGLEAPLAEAAGPRVDLHMELSPDTGPVTIDRILFGRMLSDLAELAGRNMSATGTLTVRTSAVELEKTVIRQGTAFRRGRYATISMHHPGGSPGEAGESRLFEPFSSGFEDPDGLLLPAVYGGVKQSGGHLWISSRTGKGTSYRIYLPQDEEG